LDRHGQSKRRCQRPDEAKATGPGAPGCAFWGLLFGLIFFVPLFGMAFGAAMGALGGSMRDFGIDDDFIDGVGDEVTEGTSAPFLLSGDAVVDRVEDALAGEEMELITTNLSAEDEEVPAELFAED
jgi:uncharacterized membrane protein